MSFELAESTMLPQVPADDADISEDGVAIACTRAADTISVSGSALGGVA